MPSIRLNYYAILGIKQDALYGETEADIQTKLSKIYKAKATQLRRTGTPQEIAELNEAYTVLKDPERRKNYNNTGRPIGIKIIPPEVDAKNLTPPKSAQTTPKKPGMFPIPQIPTEIIYHANKPVEIILQNFMDLVQKKIGEYYPREKNYGYELQTDLKTGKSILRLTFPDKKTLDEFNTRLQKEGYIKEISAETAPRPGRK